MLKKVLLTLLCLTVLLPTAFSQGKRHRPSRKTRPRKEEASNPNASRNPMPQKGILRSGTYYITQSWAGVSELHRPVHIKVPEGDGPFPVYIALHGRGGTGTRKLKGLKRWKALSNRIVIAPDGYNKGWSKKRPDVDFIHQIIAAIKKCSNVDGSNIAIMGNSNGAGLLNWLMIELEDDTFHHGICVSGGLAPKRYDGTNLLWDPSGGVDFTTPITPAKGRRWLQINGTEDPIIPYRGGVGSLGLEFLPAQDLFYAWAVQMGETGPKLANSEGKPYPSNSKLIIYEYLDGSFKHVKAVGYKHGVHGKEIKAIIDDFISQAPISK